jgi:DNA-binding SARP family transcriptional activator/DNA-binding CsgD family transcriptional regulator
VLFHVLGPLEVCGDAAQRQIVTGKPAILLATLLLEPNAWVAVDELVEAIWPEPAVPTSAKANLKTYAWQLRRLVPDRAGDPRIEGRPGAYRIRVGPGELDSDRFGELAAAARRAAPDSAVGLLEQALGLWRGRPFDGLDTAAARAAVIRLEQLRLEIREQLAETQLALGRSLDAVATLRAVTAEAPLREGAWVRLVQALHAAGLRAEAVAAFGQARDVLRAELGVEPGAALVAAHHLVLGGTHAGVEATLAAAGREVFITSSLRVCPGDPIGTLRRVDFDNVRRGVRYRVLFPDRARGIPTLAARLGSLALAGAEVRTLPDVPMDATVVDEVLAVLPSEGRDGRPGGVAMFRLPSVVNTIVELFELVWPSAVPLVASDVPDGAELTERERELLGLLSVGWTDESAAARLGISVRTVRRLMSTIMNRLGARSRFQAGVKAADRGWLERRAG